VDVRAVTGGTSGFFVANTGGATTLTGSKFADTLSAGQGADTLIGAAGNDFYVISNVGSIVVEFVGDGVDTVQSSVTYTLGSNVENLTLTGSAAVNGNGNILANVLTGNTGSNVLDGGFGADTMSGGLGNDTYVVDSSGDVVFEKNAEGVDLVQAMVTYALGENVENLTLAGVGAINGTGNSLANLIVGNGANNILTGGLGNDTLMGSAGQDQFVFNAAPSSMNVDTVSDFQVRTDKLLLSKAIFLKFAAVSLGQAPSADNFVKGTAALDANDYLIYNVATGVLSYDADGSGKASVATAFAKIELNGVPPSDLSAADFIISS